MTHSADGSATGSKSGTAPAAMDVSAIIAAADAQLAQLDLAGLRAAGLHRDPGNYNLLVHFLPPEVARDHAANDDLRAALQRPSGPIGLYLHIPPCTGRCTFCHYAIEVNPDAAALDRYLDALCTEMTTRWGRDDHAASAEHAIGPIASVLVGGGTPTFLSAEQLDRVLGHLHATTPIAPGTEFTVESSPETLTRAKLETLLRHRVTRLNIGLQALDDVQLRALARRHDAQGAVDAVNLAHDVGIPHVNIDLIYALPGQTLQSWLHGVALAAELGVASITTYHLRKRPDTRISRHASPDEHLNLRMQLAAHLLLTQRGYRRSLTDYYCRTDVETAQVQARDKWRDMQPVDGCGMEACSRRPDVVAFNVGSMVDYTDAVADQGGWSLAHGRLLHREEQMAQRAMFALKVLDDDGGLDHACFEAEFGVSTDDVFGPFLERMRGLGAVQDKDGRTRLSDIGALFSDEIGRQLYTPELRRRMAARMRVDAGGEAVVAPRGSRRRVAGHRDAIVVGGGSCGLAVAAELAADLGGGVLLLEREKTLGAGATGASIGGFRAQHSDAMLSEMTAVALPKLHELARDPDANLDLRADGYLFVATTYDDLGLLQTMAANANAVGMPANEVSAAQIAAIMPTMTTSDLVGGTYSAVEGHLDPHGLCQAYARRIKARGGEIRTFTGVHELVVERGRVIGVRIDEGTLTADTVILATGHHTLLLCAAAGVELPGVIGYRRIFMANGPELPTAGGPLVLSYTPRLYFRAETGGLLLSAWEFTDKPGDRADVLANLADRAVARLPALANAGIQSAWVGAQLHTPDKRPWIGPCPGLDGLVIATGLAGHGVMHAPIVGELAAGWVTGTPDDAWARAMDPRRIELT